MTEDRAIYVRFERTAVGGTKCVATEGFKGPEIARLEWPRMLNSQEEAELDMAIHLGALQKRNEERKQAAAAAAPPAPEQPPEAP